MINILYIVSSLKKSGPTKQLFNLTKNLNRHKFNPIVLTISKNPNESMIGQFMERNIEVIQIPSNKFVKKHNKINEIVKQIKPDIIHTSGIRADQLGAKFDSGIPTVSTIHNFMFMDYAFRYGKILGNLMSSFHVKYLSKVDYPIVCSESISNQYYKEKDIRYDFITNGIDINNFQPVKNKNKLRDKLNLKKDKKIIISTGHLSKLKDPFTICEAFLNSKMSQKYHLVFIGDGELKKMLIEKYENENISFIGRVDNVNEYLQASDIFISASHTEGMPNAVLEAMATELQVILSDISPHKEILRESFSSNFIFEAGNTSSLIEILNSLKEKEYSFKDNRINVENNFTDKIMSLNYEKLYYQILEIKSHNQGHNLV